ncbi:MAG: hypothetical protein A2V93_05980 [Ignavibacteria bacterium RBG_16_34_14]|nr:MAG: hypothetical protein A2V93_05980 [Ignavibacteria bacterium RBG_16_34_14]
MSAIEKKTKEDTEKIITEKYETDLKDLKNQVSEKDKRIKELNKRELELNQKERELSEKEENIINQVTEQVNKKVAEIEKKVKEDAKKESSLQMTDLQTQVSELQEKLSDAQQQELELRKKQRELEADKKEFELKKQRELDAAKAEIYKAAKSDSDSDYQMQLRENEEKLKQMTAKIEELKKKAEQGSQQLQGEVQELELEDFLSTNFIYDKVEPVQKGFRGADVIQTVRNQFGQECGKIIWESKRTTTKWSNDWISKLKEDQRNAKADIAVIVSQVLPDGVNNIAQKEDVWIVSFEAAYGITIALREQLLQIDQIKKSQIGKNEKAEVLYDYLCSNEFRQKIEGIVEAFTTMRTDLESEKRAINKHWQKREMQIDKVLKNTTGMYGGLQALIGSALPEIKALEMPEIKEEEIPPLPIDDDEEELPL